MKMKCVAFDMDDTLINTKESIKEGFKIIYSDYILKEIPNLTFIEFSAKIQNLFNDKEFMKIWGTEEFYSGIFNAFGLKCNKNLAEEVKEKYREFYHSNLKLNNGIFETLEFLERKDIKLGIVTNCSLRSIKNKLIPLKIFDKFRVIIPCKDNGILKMDLEPFKKLLKEANIKPQECVFVGNHINEDMAAKKVGIITILYDKKDQYKNSKDNYDYRIIDMEKLNGLLESLTTNN